MSGNSSKRSIKQVFLTNKQRHRAFRHHYTPTQTYSLIIANLITAVYGLFSNLILLGSSTLSARLYFQFFIISMLSLASALVVNNRRIVKSDAKRESLHEIIQMIVVLAFLQWGLAVIKNSIDIGQSVNFLPVIIVYAICTFFLYFSPQHYIVFYILCVGSAFLTSFVFKKGNADINTLTNVIFLGGVLTVGGLTKYSTSYRVFYEREKSMELQESLAATNEKLTDNNRQLMELTETLRKANESQRRFSASMNHELRSPLNGIIGLLQVLYDDKSLNEEAHENVDKALASSSTLIQIVNDLLDYAKLEAGEFNIINARFDLRETVNKIQAISEPMANNKNLSFEVYVEPDIPCIVNGDEIRLQQVITNIVSNGIKYTDAGYVKLFIDYKDGNLIAKVSDSGQGISNDAQNVLFEPFKRLSEHENRGIQGTGLGLSIVRGLLSQMHGEISVESELKKGSTFTIKVPLQVLDSNVRYSDHLEVESKSVVESIDLSGKKILCIDDNKVNLSVFNGLLKSTNATLKLLNSGFQCLDEIQKEKYDIIFIDHMMPELDGVQTLEKMKEIEHLNKDTPVVMLTANAGEEAEQAYLSKGFSAYLAKPVLKGSLFSLISRLI